MPRFAVLRHDWPTPHLDLFLESDGVLLAWRLPADYEANGPAMATRQADHRLHYLDSTGPVAGRRGSVSRWDGGTLYWLENSAELSRFELAGERLNGVYQLEPAIGGLWQFTCVSRSS